MGNNKRLKGGKEKAQFMMGKNNNNNNTFKKILQNLQGSVKFKKKNRKFVMKKIKVIK